MAVVIKKKSDRFVDEVQDKRFYLYGFEIHDECPLCKALTIFDGDCNYLSYPKFGAVELTTMYCKECDHDWKIDVVLTLEVRLAEVGEIVGGSK